MEESLHLRMSLEDLRTVTPLIVVPPQGLVFYSCVSIVFSDRLRGKVRSDLNRSDNPVQQEAGRTEHESQQETGNNQ